MTKKVNLGDVSFFKNDAGQDPRGFECLVSRYKALVRHIVCRMIAREADVEDLYQEVFVRVYEALSNVRHREKRGFAGNGREVVIACFAILVAIAVAVLTYVGLGRPRLDLSGMASTLEEHVYRASEPLASFGNALAQINHEIGLAVMAAFVLYVVLALDHLLDILLSGRRAAVG